MRFSYEQVFILAVDVLFAVLDCWNRLCFSPTLIWTAEFLVVSEPLNMRLIV